MTKRSRLFSEETLSPNQKKEINKKKQKKEENTITISFSKEWSISKNVVEDAYIYRIVAKTLTDALQDRKKESVEEKKVYQRKIVLGTLKDTVSDMLLINAEIDCLSDGLIDLYVAQTMDWLMHVEDIVGKDFEKKTRLQKMVSVGIVSLSIILKTHHCDNGIFLYSSLFFLDNICDFGSKMFIKIEKAFLRALEYNVFALKDCYTLLSRYSNTLITCQKQFDDLVQLPEFLEKFGVLMRFMTVDHIDTFYQYTPWVRTNFAISKILKKCPDQQSIRIGSPNVKEANSFFSIIEKDFS